MKNLVIILCLLIFNTSAFSDSTSNLVADKHKDRQSFKETKPYAQIIEPLDD